MLDDTSTKAVGRPGHLPAAHVVGFGSLQNPDAPPPPPSCPRLARCRPRSRCRRSAAGRNCPGGFHLRRRPIWPHARTDQRQGRLPAHARKRRIRTHRRQGLDERVLPRLAVVPHRGQRSRHAPRPRPPPSRRRPGSNLPKTTAARTTSASRAPEASATTSASAVTPPTGTFSSPGPTPSAPVSLPKSAPSRPGTNATAGISPSSSTT